MDYILRLKHGKPNPPLPTEEAFVERYEISKLNNLGAIICRWLYKAEEAKNSHESLYSYFIQMIADEKKKPKLKDMKELPDITMEVPAPYSREKNTSDNHQNTQNNQHGMPMVSSKSLNGVHPLLPMALYGGLSAMNAKTLFQSFTAPQNLQARQNSHDQQKTVLLD